MKYSAINIGPIISTLGMARKPRELWAASYLFSHLMKCIYSEVTKAEKVEIISPAKPEEDKNKVGIYPDRIYFKGEADTETILRNAIRSFYEDLYDKGKRGSNNPDLDYFNVMSATCEEDEGKESTAIGKLNKKLDVLELCNYAADKDAAQTIYNIISKKAFSSLFKLARDEEHFPIPEIEDIASVQLNVHPETKEESHHRYFCVVQADGDNVGKTVSHTGLKKGDVLKISQELVNFGLTATELIERFGGLPIYAGGDDLLFLAPVIGKDGTHIFNLLDDIQYKAFDGVQETIKKLQLGIEASLSFGVSITYQKYPLYEALETARYLLFGVAKISDRFPDKKVVAWKLRKHSGGTFEAAFSLKNQKLQEQFAALIAATNDKETVSAVAHKIRQEQALVNIVMTDRANRAQRLAALFEKVLEFDAAKEAYFNAIKDIMPTLYDAIEEEEKAYRKEHPCDDKELSEKIAEKYYKTLYCLLRTAKFIKGEDVHDE